MRRLLKGIDTVSEWTGRVTSYFIYAGTAVLLWEVLVRYTFNAPTVWAHQVSMRAFAAYYILSGGYTLLYKANVNIDLFYSRFSLRKRAIFDVFTALILFAICAIYIYYGLQYGLEALSMRETDLTPWHAPIYPFKLLIPVGGFLLLLQGLAKFYRDFATAITGRKYEH